MKCSVTFIPGRKVVRVTAHEGLVVASSDVGPQVARSYDVSAIKREMRDSVRAQLAARRPR